MKKLFLDIKYLSILAHMVNCEDKKTSYFCPEHLASNRKKTNTCIDGSSFVCDLSNDCDGGEDETEPYCGMNKKIDEGKNYISITIKK